MPVDVFISHITEESGLATILKDALLDGFDNRISVFVSSDKGASLPMGEDYIRNIEKALQECKVALILISNKSVNRNWINLESGVLWMRKLSDPTFPIIPVCHSGFRVSDLQLPFKTWQAASANNIDSLTQIISTISKKVSTAGDFCIDFNMDFLHRDICSKENEYMLLNDFERVLTMCKFSAPKDFIEQILTRPTSNVYESRLDIVQSTFLEIQSIISGNPLLARCVSLKQTGGMFIGAELTLGFQIKSTLRIDIDTLQSIIKN